MAKLLPDPKMLEMLQTLAQLETDGLAAWWYKGGPRSVVGESGEYKITMSFTEKGLDFLRERGYDVEAMQLRDGPIPIGELGSLLEGWVA